jgi:hypothetical protein
MKPKLHVKRGRRFIVTMSVEIEIAPALLKSVLTDEWRKVMFPFYTAEEVAAHLAFNMVQGTQLGNIDGYADQPSDRVWCGHLGTDDTAEVK